MADYDGQDVERMDEEQPQQRLRSTVVSEKRKGRGFRAEEREEEGNTRYESLEPAGGTGPAKSGEYELGGACDGLLHSSSLPAVAPHISPTRDNSCCVSQQSRAGSYS
eukprot:GHUV01020016.1.p1 GENE.GHUV01020016.1~~GHUV01020016.1.p1  ORF type:complete len:108 (+),score=12.51 GHUV01020016.1:122-445(+)